MANTTVLQNKLYGTAVVHLNGSDTLVIPGNSTVSSIATGDETLVGANIKQVWWGGAGANDNWSLSRNSVKVATFNGSGHISYAAFGASLNLEAASNVVATFTGSGGYIMIEFQKIANSYPSTY